MFKKLFTRKKAPVVAVKPAKPEPTSVPNSSDEWAASLSEATGKAKNQLMNRLVDQIEQSAIALDSAISKLQPIDAAMIQLQLGSEVTELNESQWQQIVLDGFTAKVRKQAAEQITSEDAVSSLVKSTKGKDKTVYRILHDKQEAHHEAEKIRIAYQQKKSAVLEGIEKLADSPLEPMYEARLKGLIEQWRELNVQDDDELKKFEAFQQTAQGKITEIEAQRQAEDAFEQTLEMADSNRQALIDGLIGKLLERVDELTFSDEAISADQHFLTDVQHQWREIEQHSKATKDEYRAFQKASTAFEVGLPRIKNVMEKYGELDTIIQRLDDTEANNEQLLHDVDDWLHEIEFALVVRVPQNVVNLKQALEQYQKSLAEHRQHEIDRVRSIRGQLRRCLSAVEEGSLRRASGLYHGIEEKLEGFDLEHHGGIRKQLEETTEALEKLRDWQSYAVLPKKEALIKRMSALVTQSLDPESRAQSIREMQEEWKSLSRGLQNRQQDLWEEFHELAQKAYEPCKEFFAEQKNLRDVNLARRKEIIEQLSTYDGLVDWESPDIKEIDRVLQVARNDWRHYSPVDRVANKPVQTQFDKIHQAIFNKLKKEQDVFKENKRQIIEKAKQLLELEDVKEATEQAKKLQKDWKSAGIVARKDEQELWKAFREVCDALFDKREQQVNAFKADLETNREQAELVINSIAALLESEELLAEQSVFENLKAQYEQIGTLPKAHYQKMTKRYKDVCQDFTNAIRAANSEKADQHWVDLIDWVKRARFSDQTLDAMLAEWQALKLPAGAQTLKTSFEDWRAPADELNQAAMHEKTIDLEILSGITSPESDSEIRMNLQVQRLSEGFGAGSSQKDLDALVLEWLSLGAIEVAEYERFETRMKAARTHLLKQKVK